jgi:hypothetical protein
MSAKLHRFATKISVCDSFALGMEQIEVSQFEREKPAKVRTKFQKEKQFEKIGNFVLSNSTQSPIT